MLDIGCHEGEFLRSLGNFIGPSVGFDPLAPAVSGPSFRLIPEAFPGRNVFPDGSFDAAVLLATLEHLPEPGGVAAEIHRLLCPGGRVILTVPAHQVDGLLTILKSWGVIDGMALDEHHGFDPAGVPTIFAPPRFFLKRHGHFQLGCNNLFVFDKV